MLRFKTINWIVIVVLILLLAIDYSFNLPFFCYPLLLVFWVFITLLGSTQIRWNYHFTSLNSNKAIQKNVVAITFDDGPNPEFTLKVLSLLEKYNAKATFFCIGKKVEAHPTLFNELVAKGHTVGNHTYTHGNGFGFFSIEKVTAELKKTNAIIKETSGLHVKLFRPAFGITNPNIKKAIQITGLQSIGWNKRPFDTTRLSEEKILSRITNHLKKGDIILLHDSSEKSIRVLEQLLLFLQANNLQSVTVDQLLSIDAYA